MHTNTPYNNSDQNNYFGAQVDNQTEQPYVDYGSNQEFGYDEQQEHEYQEGNEELLENADFDNDNDVEWFEIGTIETSPPPVPPNAVTSISYDNY